MEAHPLERAVGIHRYITDVPGTGGRLRERPEDFRVIELEDVDWQPIDADPAAYPHLVCRVRLRGWDTNDFARALSDRLAISRERVAWAGTKDKHAVTTQLVSIRGPDLTPADLPAIDEAAIEAIGRLGRALQFGDLAGNAFEIAVRDAEATDRATEVAAALRTFEAETPDTTEGAATIPNFFGQQRFGSRRAITHEVGFAVLRGSWRDAVLAYAATPSDREPASSRSARERLADEADSADPDWGGALKAFPSRLGFERSMIQTLSERDAGPADEAAFRAALETVPSNLQAMFVNAAQSFAFNEMLSRRIERGLPVTQPVAGDVVCFTERVRTTVNGQERDLVVPDADRCQRVDDGRVATIRRHCDRGRAFVALPLVGIETTFADGDPGEIERAVCSDLGIEPADFDLPEPFASRGTRRAAVVRSDLVVESEDGADDAYRLSFQLPSGSYATVVLREFMKVSPELL